MIKAILFKEYVKTRAFCLIALAASCGLVAHSLMKMQYVISAKGASHLWLAMLERDAVFVNRIAYIPPIMALVLAIAQFVPEMQQKRLKLTLHLPYPKFLNVAVMLSWGAACLIGCFALHFAMIWLYTRAVLPYELSNRIMLTALPWYLAGLMAYSFTSWTVLEPTWKRRIVNIAVGLAATSVVYLSSTPEAYNNMLPLLAVYTVLTFFLPMLSVQRFMDGRQD